MGASSQTMPVKQGNQEMLQSCRLGRALARTIGQHLLICKLLHDLDDERHPFCSLTAVETDHVKLATGRRLKSSKTKVRAAIGDASASGMTLAVAVMAKGPPTSNSSAREALVRWVDGAVV
jgi:hypothetical protein